MRCAARHVGARIVFVLCLVTATTAWTAPRDPALACDHAAQKIAKESNIPLDVLRAITRTETGRGQGGTLKPWPWTVNMEGRGVWFDTEQQAQVFVFRHFKEGARSFDIGCFQINYRWHGHAFASIEDMFDPMHNARYAARFLRELHGEFGDWTRAAGAFHSRTHKHAERYIRRYEQIHATLPAVSAGLTNGFPLLQPQAAPRAAGSLVPQTEGAGRSLFNPQTGG
jgi:hypothetical protein